MWFVPDFMNVVQNPDRDATGQKARTSSNFENGCIWCNGGDLTSLWRSSYSVKAGGVVW